MASYACNRDHDHRDSLSPRTVGTVTACPVTTAGSPAAAARGPGRLDRSGWACHKVLGQKISLCLARPTSGAQAARAVAAVWASGP